MAASMIYDRPHYFTHIFLQIVEMVYKFLVCCQVYGSRKFVEVKFMTDSKCQFGRWKIQNDGWGIAWQWLFSALFFLFFLRFVSVFGNVTAVPLVSSSLMLLMSFLFLVLSCSVLCLHNQSFLFCTVYFKFSSAWPVYLMSFCVGNQVIIYNRAYMNMAGAFTKVYIPMIAVYSENKH